MQRALYLLISLFVCAGLAGCARAITAPPNPAAEAVAAEELEQGRLALEHRRLDAARLHKIGWSLLSANAPLCSETRTAYGIRVWNNAELPDLYRKAADELYALGDALSVEGMPAESPAAKAGLKPGDIIRAVNGDPAPTGRNAASEFRATMRELEADAATLEIERDGEAISITMTGAALCDYGIVYLDAPDIDAHADGRDIFVTRGLMSFTPSDDELAMVAAHELAHNKLRHTNHKLSNGVLGMIGGGALDVILATGGIFTGGGFAVAGANITASAYTLDFEREADYLGLYFMARAGYDTKKAANFWRRMAIENSIFIERASTHPSSAERYLSMMLTHDEIMKKKKAGEALTPNLQKNAP